MPKKSTSLSKRDQRGSKETGIQIYDGDGDRVEMKIEPDEAPGRLSFLEHEVSWRGLSSLAMRQGANPRLRAISLRGEGCPFSKSIGCSGRQVGG
jgi:hypothetical protein